MKNLIKLILLGLLSITSFANGSKNVDHLVFETQEGPIVIELDSVAAPIHFDQINKLAEMGIYSGIELSYAAKDFYVQMGDETRREYGFYPEQAEVIKSLPNELNDFNKHYRGAVSMPANPEDADLGGKFVMTFLLDRAESLDGKQTVIGFVTHGLEKLDSISNYEADDDLIRSPVKIISAKLMTKDAAINMYKQYHRDEFASDIFNFTQYSFLFIIIIQLILFFAKEKIAPQIKESTQIVVLLVAVFSVLAQFYPMAGESTIASTLMVAALLLCFKVLASLEHSRGLTK